MPFDLPSLTKIKNALLGRSTPDEVETGVMEGRTVAGRFTILRRIGVGGMGSVYVARQTSMDRDVAIKILNAANRNDEGARARFRIEAAAVSRLRNPHTITVFDFGEDDDGELFLVMELLEGRSLASVFHETGPMDAATVMAIADQILDSLAEAHSAGILHRDLKPENIFIKQDPEQGIFVKVLDFGIARIISGPQATQAWPGVVFGTPAYMSPEQVMGRPGDQRSDLYSLAVVIFELLTGTLPITGGSPIEIGVRKVRNQPPALEAVNPGRTYPPGASDFLRKALSPDPSGRPLTARDFRIQMHEAFGAAVSAAGKPVLAPRRKQARTGPRVMVSTEDRLAPGWKYDGERESVESTRPLRRPLPETPLDQAGPPDADHEPPPRPVPSILEDAPLSDFDRRGARRAARLVTARCYYNGENFTATVSDLSGTGGFVSSARLPVVGHRITLVFTCPGTNEYNISLLAEVIRISPGSAAPGDIRGFAVRWLKMRARGDLACVMRFLESTVGVELTSSLPENASAPRWEYLFEGSKFV